MSWFPWQFTQRGASGSPRATALPWSERACCSCSVEWHVPHFTGAGFSCGKSFPSRSAWQPVHPKLPCTEVANFLASTYSETVLPARVVLMLLSPWHARHSAPGWSAARAGRCANSRENSVATSVARIILRPARHFLRTFFVSAIFVSAMSNFRAGFINALQLPSGAKVCARELGRPSGTCIGPFRRLLGISTDSDTRTSVACGRAQRVDARPSHPAGHRHLRVHSFVAEALVSAAADDCFARPELTHAHDRVGDIPSAPTRAPPIARPAARRAESLSLPM